MARKNLNAADFGNWVSRKLVIAPAVLGLLFLGLTFLFQPLFLLAVLLLLVAAYFFYARLQFSARGGKVQEKIQALVVRTLRWDGVGRAIDIGCGNGPLTIRLAETFPRAQITGIDSWGGMWEYSQAACEANARNAGVSDRVTFQKASAAKLPFPDGYFDAAVSNLVFHEVAEAKDKMEVVREALRVVRPGGAFAFQDLFLIKQIYGAPDTLIARIKAWGVQTVELVETRNQSFIPALLKLPFMVGTIALMTGEK
jgi:ubiquinone/menaquinone biosynthesis C-methylase UbiE